MRPRRIRGWLLCAALAAGVATATAATPAQKCAAGKNRAAGAYAGCRHRAEARFALAPDLTRLTNGLRQCDAKYDAAWSRAEARAAAAGVPCPSVGDGRAVRDLVGTDTGLVATALAGHYLLFPTHGAPLQTGQTLCVDAAATAAIPCAATHQDGELQRGLGRVHVDNGDGTITDTRTTLMWEKLSHDDSIHDVSDAYTWTAVFTDKVAALNAMAFAGYSDWRVPNVVELQSLMDYGAPNTRDATAVSPAFDTGCVFGCTVLTCSCSGPYIWSSTTTVRDRSRAWGGTFADGSLQSVPKSVALGVRAVRGGL